MISMRSGRFLRIFLLVWNILAYGVDSFNIKLTPLSVVDLVTYDNQSLSQSSALSKIVFKYPQVVDENERFKLINVDVENNFITFGARNRLITIVKSERSSSFHIYESFFPAQERAFRDKNCSDRNCANYILTTLPINKDKFNSLVCGSYYGLFQCIQAEQDRTTGLIDSYDDVSRLSKAPKSVTLPLNNENAYYLSKTRDDQHILYAASSWTDTSQYLAAHLSENNYQDDTSNKKIGVSKSFVRFLESNDRLFLFQNELSYDIDDGERDRDILISTSMVSQICKNDQEVVNKEMAFYTELTAKIYCFNEPFKSSGSSRMFKFDSLEYVTDLINLQNSNQTRKLFYGVFNTPKNQITGTAICLFDIDDMRQVFQKKNFKYLDDSNENSAKNSHLNPQDCPKLTSHIDKLKYRSFTSKLSYMTKSVLPLQKRKASFITTNDYRISCLHVMDDADVAEMKPTLNKLERFENLKIIFAGTDNGKVMRIAHYFSNNYFNNENLNEELIEILEEIQLFDRNTKINQISLLRDGDDKKKLIINTNKQIKIIPIDFCELFSSSCEACLNTNQIALFKSKCQWKNNQCKSISLVDHDDFLYHHNLHYLDKFYCAHLRSTTNAPTSRMASLWPNDDAYANRTHLNASDSINLLSDAEPTSNGFRSNRINNTNMFDSAPGFSAQYLKNMTSFVNMNALVNQRDNKQTPADLTGNFFIDSRTNFNDSLDHYFSKNLKQTNDPILIVVFVSLVVSFVMLVCGILIGYVLKAKYSKVIVKKMDSYLSSKKKANGTGGDPGKYSSGGQPITASNVVSNQYQPQSKIYSFKNKHPQLQQQINYLSDDYKLNLNDESLTESTSTSSSVQKQQQHMMATNNNDYGGGMLPIHKGLTAVVTSTTTTTSTSGPSTPHRLSSSSSSTDSASASASTSSTSSYCAPYNLVNSQTCLLLNSSNYSRPSINGVVSSSSKCAEVNNNNNNNSAENTTVSTHVSPALKYSACIVVNDDERLEVHDLEQQQPPIDGGDKTNPGAFMFGLPILSQLESNRSSVSSASNHQVHHLNYVNSTKYHKHHHVRKQFSILYAEPKAMPDMLSFRKGESANGPANSHSQPILIRNNNFNLEETLRINNNSYV